jgi:hypothetical protein
MWQIARHYPYLIPLLVAILILTAVGHVIEFTKKLLQKNNCPGCCEDKVVCLVACERISRRLSEVKSEVMNEPLS